MRLLRGHSPQGISKGNPLRHAFRIFPRERKDTAVWSAQLHEGRFAETLVCCKTQNIFTAPKQNQILKESVIHSLFSFLVKLDIERVSQMC